MLDYKSRIYNCYEKYFKNTHAKDLSMNISITLNLIIMVKWPNNKCLFPNIIYCVFVSNKRKVKSS